MTRLRASVDELLSEARATTHLHLRRGIDGASIGRAVGNLIDNAVKHSPEGGTVGIVVGERRSRAFVSVTDGGTGIVHEDVPHIFDRYWTADPEVGEGHGIGLALVKQVADAHGGIEVESPLGPDGGTRFTLWFDS